MNRLQVNEQIHWFHVDGQPICVRKYAISKIFGFMWTGPKLHCLIVVARKWNILILATLILSVINPIPFFLPIISALTILLQ